jgi:predicted acyl esterase
VGRLGPVAAGALALALAWAGTASAFTKRDEVVRMADGVPVATTLYLPDGTPPAGGWPALIMLHGLAGARGDVAPVAEAQYAAQDYAVLTYDARGHGQSGGVAGLAGPDEIADVRALFARLAARPDVDDAHIGGWGVSAGGAAILRAAVEGVPFAALVPHMTWSDLYGALLPQNLAKSGVLSGFVQSLDRPSPLLARVRDDALSGRNLAGLRGISAERSTALRLGGLRTPTFWIQGKRDFAFDMLQAIDAFRRLAGPKRLYLGNLGHAPSTFAADDAAYFLAQGRVWCDRFLKDVPNGIDTRLPVEFATTPYVPGRIARYRLLPRVVQGSYLLPGRRRTIRPGATVALRTPRLDRALETFGRAEIQVRANARGGWPRLVAMLTAEMPDGREIPIGGGGVPLRDGERFVTIRLTSTATPVPRGARLRLVFGAASPGLYLRLAVPPRARVTVSAARLLVPRLWRPVSVKN